jgi:hypothetical protein
MMTRGGGAVLKNHYSGPPPLVKFRIVKGGTDDPMNHRVITVTTLFHHIQT